MALVGTTVDTKPLLTCKRRTGWPFSDVAVGGNLTIAAWINQIDWPPTSIFGCKIFKCLSSCCPLSLCRCNALTATTIAVLPVALGWAVSRGCGASCTRWLPCKLLDFEYGGHTRVTSSTHVLRFCCPSSFFEVSNCIIFLMCCLQRLFWWWVYMYFSSCVRTTLVCVYELLPSMVFVQWHKYSCLTLTVISSSVWSCLELSLQLVVLVLSVIAWWLAALPYPLSLSSSEQLELEESDKSSKLGGWSITHTMITLQAFGGRRWRQWNLCFATTDTLFHGCSCRTVGKLVISLPSCRWIEKGYHERGPKRVASHYPQVWCHLAWVCFHRSGWRGGDCLRMRARSLGCGTDEDQVSISDYLLRAIL